MQLKGKKAVLLAEGCKLNKEKKAIDTRMKEIKKSLDFTEEGKYHNDAGDLLVVSSTDIYTEIKGKDVLAMLKARKMGKRIWECVKVNVTGLRKLATDEEVDRLRKKKGTTIKWCFK